MTRSLLLGALVYLAVRVLTDALPASFDEPLPLRWLRSVADRPDRSPGACACLAHALRRLPTPPPTAVAPGQLGPPHL